MDVQAALQKIKTALSEHYRERFHGILLYGSESRGQSNADSDIDILCILEGTVNVWKEIDAIIDVTYPLQLEYPERSFHIMPCSREDMDRGTRRFLNTVRTEGIAV